MSRRRDRPGKPIQFLTRVLGGWVALRAGMVLVPLVSQMLNAVPAPRWAHNGGVRDTGRSGPAEPVQAVLMAATWPASPHRVLARTERKASAALAVPSQSGWTDAVADRLMGVGFAFTRPRGLTALQTAAREPGRGEAPTAVPIYTIPGAVAAIPRPSPWSAVAWMLWRPDIGGGLAQGPLLGGSQMGARIDYRLWAQGDRSVALYGRITRAFARPFAEEAALGLSVRPVAGLPVAILAERRERLGTGGRSGFALMAAGGIGPKPLAPRLAMEGYAQAGVVGLPGSDLFADGRLALGYRLTAAARPQDVALGVGVSGGAQPGASRVDIGPELRVRLPVASGHVRLGAEWRQRVAGDARPSSGPALTLVADF